MKELSVSKGIELCGGEDCYRVILQAFADEYNKTKRKNLVTSITDRNSEDFIVTVHGLKSIYAMLGADEAAELAAELNRCGVAGDYGTMWDKSGKMLDISDETACLVSEYLKEKST